MKNIMMLAKANLRKSKSQTFSILLITIVAAMLFNIGLVLFSGAGNFFDQRAEALNTPHFVAIHPASDPLDIPLNYIENFEGFVEVETQNVLHTMGGFSVNGELISGHIIISSQSPYQLMNPPSLIGDYLPLIGNAIYIPHFLFLDGGFQLGDNFLIEFMGEELLFNVAGSNEEIMFGSGMSSVWRVYVAESRFAELTAEFPNSDAVLISARLTTDGRVLATTYGAEFGVLTLSYGAAQNNRTFISIIAASMMVTFAITLLIISVIVMRFRISNDIEESMKNIGVLKAVGYRNHQIILSVVTQFGAIAFVGGIIGILLSQALLPMAASILEPQLGLVWNPAFDLTMMFITLGLLLVLTLLFSYVTARRIKKLHPLIALRGGMTTHSFTKNPMPLDKTRSTLNFALAIKQLLKNKKQAIMVGLIIAAVAFVSIEGFLINYNININPSSFMRLFGEVPDVFAMVEDVEQVPQFREQLALQPEFERVFGVENFRLITNDIPVLFTVVEDFSYLAGNELISGRYPILSNEIALDRLALSEMGKDVGDWVTIQSGDYEKDYIITGIVQEMNALIGMMSYSGLKYIQPDFAFRFLFVYVTDGADVDEFISAFNAANEEIATPLINAQSQFDAQMGAMGDIFGAVNVVIMFVAATVVVLVLYLIIKTIIIRRRRELGIQKALGFTTLQLMNQITLSLTPSILLGVMFGTIAAYVFFNPLFVLMSSSMGLGISQANLLTPIVWILVTSASLAVLAYVVSMLVAWRIRKISAYALVSE